MSAPLVRHQSLVAFGLGPNGDGEADVMNVCLGIGQDLTGAAQYGYRDTGNIPAAGINGFRVTGDDCYNPTL